MTLSTGPFGQILCNSRRLPRSPNRGSSAATITEASPTFAASRSGWRCRIHWLTISALHVMLQAAEVQFNIAAIHMHHHLLRLRRPRLTGSPQGLREACLRGALSSRQHSHLCRTSGPSHPVSVPPRRLPDFGDKFGYARLCQDAPKPVVALPKCLPHQFSSTSPSLIHFIHYLVPEKERPLPCSIGRKQMISRTAIKWW